MSTILPDFLTRVRPAVDLTVQPVAPNKDVQDVLSRLASGQRVFAEILNVLPNGTYRAVVAQREMVLALPFAAKSGDTLELQVVNSDGKVAFAVVAGRNEALANPAAMTTLSPAGQLISQLLGRSASPAEQSAPALLGAGKPLLGAPPASAQGLVPVLQQAVADSGLFYEAHQARWIDGRYPLATLASEPQQRLTSGVAAPTAASTMPGEPPARAALVTGQAATAGVVPGTAAPGSPRQDAPATHAPAAVAGGEARAAAALSLPREVMPLVQQQLHSLDTGVYLWHGQIWPGQTMEWAIVDEDAHRQAGGEATGDDGTWRSRLRLRFPALGTVAADIQLRGDRLEVVLASPEARELLEQGVASLQAQFDGAGLKLTRITVNDHAPDA